MADFLHVREHFDAGDFVRLEINRAVCIRFMTDANFNQYKNRRRYEFYGQVCRESPAELAPPRAGMWNVVIDLNGAGGIVRHKIVIVRA